ncbi:DNA polymerase III subunit epsilon [Spirochaetia bacterium]|nr:DNA polymerase III subunit epsilon [Spirochaetia bacterium]
MDSYDWAMDAYREGAAFTAFDIETTGLDPKLHRIVELGAVKFDHRGIISRFSVLIDPGIPMPPEAGRVNKITDEMLAGKPPIDRVLPDFIRFIGNTILAAHNAPFDCGFINENLKSLYEKGRKASPAQSGFFDGPENDAEGAAPWTPPYPALPHKIADTLLMARRLFPGLSSYKLGGLAAFLKIDTKDAHRAEDDARVCMEIFIQCVEKK